MAFRLRRLRSAKPKQRRVLGVHPLPTLVTLGNLLCGFASIMFALRSAHPAEGPYSPEKLIYFSGLLIFLAMIFDMLDGKVARWTKSASKFGMEMDSLCDVISFGLAPAVLVKATLDLVATRYWTVLQSYPIVDRYVWPMLALYVCCAALRLARYNVESENSGHKNFFYGLPSPAAAGCISSLVVLLYPVLNTTESENQVLKYLRTEEVVKAILLSLPFVMLGLGVLMVSRVHYTHVGDKVLRKKLSFFQMLFLGLFIISVIIWHEYMLALFFNGYMIVGILMELCYQLIPSTRPPGWEVEENVARPPSNANLPSLNVHRPENPVPILVPPQIASVSANMATNTEPPKPETPPPTA